MGMIGVDTDPCAVGTRICRRELRRKHGEIIKLPNEKGTILFEFALQTQFEQTCFLRTNENFSTFGGRFVRASSSMHCKTAWLEQFGDNERRMYFDFSLLGILSVLILFALIPCSDTHCVLHRYP